MSTAKSDPTTEAINPLEDPKGWLNSLKPSDYGREPTSLERQLLLGPLDTWRRAQGITLDHAFMLGQTLRHDFPKELGG